MKLPQIKRATWEKDCHPGAKWIVVERKYNTYDVCETFGDALRFCLWHLGVPAKIAFGWFRRNK